MLIVGLFCAFSMKLKNTTMMKHTVGRKLPSDFRSKTRARHSNSKSLCQWLRMPPPPPRRVEDIVLWLEIYAYWSLILYASKSANFTPPPPPDALQFAQPKFPFNFRIQLAYYGFMRHGNQKLCVCCKCEDRKCMYSTSTIQYCTVQ